MRPICLRMTAFGPYKDEEVIDFRQLKDHTLFVISGNTGSGKTTIFDAICFALYGTASGQDRDHHSMLRSDFADPQVNTSVELIFTIHQRQYRIFRQLAHVKPGNKTATGEKYEFYELLEDGERPVVERQIVSEINKKLEDIIGLTENQFKQIVMLPQGEFLKLLTSETENKEAILRRLFRTDHYQALNELLGRRKNEAEDAYQVAKTAIDQTIAHIPAILPKREDSELYAVLEADYYHEDQLIKGLGLEGKYYSEKTKKDQTAYQNKNKAYEKSQETLYQARTLNEKFVELEEKQALLQSLEKKRLDIKQREKELALAKQAEQIKPYEGQYLESRATLGRQSKIVDQLSQDLSEIGKVFQVAEKDYIREKENEPHRQALEKDIHRLRDHLPFVKALNDRQKRVKELVEALAQRELRLGKVKANLEKSRQKAKEQADLLAESEKETAAIPEKEQALIRKRDSLGVLEHYVTASEQFQQRQQAYESNQTDYQKARESYEAEEGKWLNNQAHLLALSLQSGEPCPVCGSLDHPDQARVAEEEVSQSSYLAARKKAAEAESEYNRAYALLEAAGEQLKEAEKRVLAQDLPLESLARYKEELVQGIKALQADLDELNQQLKDQEERRREKRKIEETISRLNESLEDEEKSLAESKLTYERERAVLENEISRIPESLRQLEELEAKIAGKEKELETYRKALERAEQAYRDSQEAETRLKAQLQAAQERLKEVEEETSQRKQAFYLALDKHGFTSVEEYAQAALESSRQEQLEQEISRFHKTYALTKEQVKQLEGELASKERVDLQVLEQRVLKLKAEMEGLLDVWQRSRKLAEEAGRLKLLLQEALVKLEQAEARLNMMADLYDVARGQNDQRLSFERFLQIEYLEDIIEAANHRLQRLSNGQFWLQRSDRKESHGRQSGLAFDVFDEYTGTVRDVKSLSGGEKFNASLCLALGMSDVIQSFQGNISIETMFIDEGFGSLDEDTLDKAIETLIELQASGRMIGLISHVQTLKTIFPAVLEVKKTRDGYSQTRFVIS